MLQLIKIISKSSQFFSLILLSISAIAAVAATTMAAFGTLPWLTLPLTFGEATIANAGMYVQIALTATLVCVALTATTHGRVLSLENSHRRFHIKMEDVTRAYHIAHTADRAGVFTMSAEFDAVRERLAYLRDHPELPQLETDVLEVAAQMSQQSRHLADVYNDEKVTRAKAFLAQRQEEAEDQQEKIVQALHDTQEISHWAQQVELEESIVASQLSQLEEKLQSALPALGFDLSRREDNVVALQQKPAAE